MCNLCEEHIGKRRDNVGSDCSCWQRPFTNWKLAAALRKRASTCQFGTFLDEALRDRLVCGIKDPATQRRLLAELKLTLDKALEFAQDMEDPAKQAQQLTSGRSTPADSINFQNRRHGERKNQRYEQTRCWRCNGQNHRASECRFRTEKCRKCDGMGHIA